jgi:hypothetical protein
LNQDFFSKNPANNNITPIPAPPSHYVVNGLTVTDNLTHTLAINSVKVQVKDKKRNVIVGLNKGMHKQTDRRHRRTDRKSPSQK